MRDTCHLKGPKGPQHTNEAPWGASALANMTWMHCDVLAPRPKVHSPAERPNLPARVWAGYGPGMTGYGILWLKMCHARC